MNGIDINRFQFEYDLTWMSFFQNSKGETYARYGGRDDDGAESQLSQKSLVQVMKQVLTLHKNGDAKPASQFDPAPDESFTPEQIPGVKKMLVSRKDKCIHCHDVKSSQLKALRSSGKLTKEMIFTYPSPSNLGIQLDAHAPCKIISVTGNSAAETAGIKAGDRLNQINGQRVLTFADVTRVLELAPETGTLNIQFERGKDLISAQITLAPRWKISSDPSWRESSHIVGPSSGFWGVKLNEAQRKNQKLTPENLALKTTAIWGAWARKAGIKHGDIVVSIDGLTTDMSIRQLQTHLHMNKNWGDDVTIVVRRSGRNKSLKMTLPDKPKD